MRPGPKTTEFWLSVLIVVSATVLVGIGQLEPEAWSVAVGVAGGGYAVSRGLAKRDA